MGFGFVGNGGGGSSGLEASASFEFVGSGGGGNSGLAASFGFVGSGGGGSSGLAAIFGFVGNGGGGRSGLEAIFGFVGNGGGGSSGLKASFWFVGSGGGGSKGLAIAKPVLTTRTEERIARRTLNEFVFIDYWLRSNKLCTEMVPQKLYNFYYKSNFLKKGCCFSTVSARFPQG